MIYSEMLEWLAVVTALLYVFLASKGNRYCFVFGLISSAIFIQICYSDKLYFDTVINVYYVIMSFVGWFSWKTESGIFKAKKMQAKLFVKYTLTAFAISVALGYFININTEASLPYVDSFTTVMAVLATWMMVKRIIQNWLIWIFADGISIGMYFYKDHYPIAMLFAIYTVISIFGYFNWKKALRTNE